MKEQINLLTARLNALDRTGILSCVCEFDSMASSHTCFISLCSAGSRGGRAESRNRGGGITIPRGRPKTAEGLLEKVQGAEGEEQEVVGKEGQGETVVGREAGSALQGR